MQKRCQTMLGCNIIFLIVFTHPSFIQSSYFLPFNLATPSTFPSAQLLRQIYCLQPGLGRRNCGQPATCDIKGIGQFDARDPSIGKWSFSLCALLALLALAMSLIRWIDQACENQSPEHLLIHNCNMTVITMAQSLHILELMTTKKIYHNLYRRLYSRSKSFFSLKFYCAVPSNVVIKSGSDPECVC